MAHLEQHLRLLLPAGVLALEEVAEEPLLQLDAVVGVEVGPVLDAVHLEPFLLRRRRARSPRNCRAGAAPARPSWRRRAAGTLTFDQSGMRDCQYSSVASGLCEAVLVEVAPVGAELLLGQRRRPGHPVAVHPAPVAARAPAVLHLDDLRREPVCRSVQRMPPWWAMSR